MSNGGNDIPSTSTTTPTPTRIKRKKMKNLDDTAKQVIHNVNEFFDKFKNPENRIEINLEKVQDVVAQVCGVSKKTVQNVAREFREKSIETSTASSSDSSPQKRQRKCTVTGIDDFDKDVIRRIVQSFYDEKTFPTLAKIRQRMIENMKFKGSIRSVKTIVNKVGFHYTKAKDGRKMLMERTDIVAKRLQFLREMHEIRQNSKDMPVYYLDETWVNQNHSRSYAWESPDSTGMKVPIGKGGRLIVCHIGSEKTGFISQCEWIFRAKKSADTDYHSEMNAISFGEWFKNMLLNLEEPSIIVMDNASYHSVILNKAPTMAARKPEMQDWLREKGIPFVQAETKTELHHKIKLNSTERIYELDQLANEWGHRVVRLPPYHCHYNPIELIWAQVKHKVATRNKTFKMDDVELLTKEAIKEITVEDWKNCVHHAEEYQEYDFYNECAREITIEPLIINFGDGIEEDQEDDIFFSNDGEDVFAKLFPIDQYESENEEKK